MGSKNRRVLGSGIVPGPRPTPAPAAPQLDATADQLRELIREARGVLKDLERERRAVEKLAADKAEAIIEARVNVCMDQLNDHIAQTIKLTDAETRKYFQRVVNDALLQADAEAPTLTAVIEAVNVLRRAAVHQTLAGVIEDA